MPERGESDFDVRQLGSVLGWGGVVIRSDGSRELMPEHEALAAAIPQWVHLPEQVDDAVAICLEVVTRPEAIVRVAAVSAFGAIARRHARVPREEAVRQAVALALVDPVQDVRAAAAVAQQAIDQAIGR